MRPARATPVTMPRFRAVATLPETVPLRFCGMALMAAAELGEMNRATPIPARARKETTRGRGVSAVSLERKKRAVISKSIPVVHKGREPVLS